jgi:hypothetical protein
MLDVVTECCRVSRGLVLVNCAGQTKDWRYQPGPELLLADWWRRGGECWRPAYWHRVGIPGSGGKQWLRADVEYVLAFKGAAGAVPWADNTACGKPPKYGPGGELSYRNSAGRRLNQWGPVGSEKGFGSRRPNGAHKSYGRPSHMLCPGGGAVSNAHEDGRRRNARTGGIANMRVTSGTGPTSEQLPNGSKPHPVLANPGNLVEEDVCSLRIIDKLADYGTFTQTDPDSILRDMRNAADAQTVRRWWAGILARVFEAQLLQPPVQRSSAEATEWPEAGWSATPGPKDRKTQNSEGSVRNVRHQPEVGGASSRRRCDEQRNAEPSSSLYGLSSEDPQDRELFCAQLRQAISSDGILLSALRAVEEVWQSFDESAEQPLEAADCSGLISGIPVGGGKMGSSLCHVNEAPFPEALAAFFVKSFCPPGGTVLDPFSGSGTTVAVARRLGRTGIGMDLRLNQCQLGRQRLAEPPKAAKRPRVPPVPVEFAPRLFPVLEAS